MNRKMEVKYMTVEEKIDMLLEILADLYEERITTTGRFLHSKKLL